MRYFVFVLATLLALPAAAQEAAPAIHRPVLSPLGNEVAYMVMVEQDWELFVSNIDGSNPRRITDHPGWDGYATWSPDGKSLVFDRGEVDDGAKQPFVVQLDDLNVSMLQEYAGWVSISAWLPNGEMMGAYQREPDGQRDLVWIDRQTGGISYITETADRSEGDAVMAPDGKSIFFFDRMNEKSSLSRIDLATGARERLYAAYDRGYGTAVSPDGRHIAFVDVFPGEENSDIFMLDLAQDKVQRLTTDPGWDHMPEWTHDGSAIIFTSYRSGTERPYLFTIEGAQTYPLDLP